MKQGDSDAMFLPLGPARGFSNWRKSAQNDSWWFGSPSWVCCSSPCPCPRTESLEPLLTTTVLVQLPLTPRLGIPASLTPALCLASTVFLTIYFSLLSDSQAPLQNLSPGRPRPRPRHTSSHKGLGLPLCPPLLSTHSCPTALGGFRHSPLQGINKGVEHVTPYNNISKLIAAAATDDGIDASPMSQYFTCFHLNVTLSKPLK